MSEYIRSIEEFVSSLRGGSLFLSPKEKAFIGKFEEMGIPEDILKRAISKCINAFPHYRRSKVSLLMCRHEIEREIMRWRRSRKSVKREDWLETFMRKLKEVGVEVRNIPSTEEEAQRILKEKEREIASELWNKLSEEERKRIISKYERYKEDEETFRSLIAREVLRKFKLPVLSLYVS